MRLCNRHAIVCGGASYSNKWPRGGVYSLGCRQWMGYEMCNVTLK